MNTNINDIEVNESNEFENVKSHWNKHKKKYIVGGLIALGFGLGFHFGNKGNSKHHYTRLLKDGVHDAVKEGMKDVVDHSMREVVRDGMKPVVKEVVRDAVNHDVKHIIRDTVKKAINDSAVTIVKEVVSVVEKEPLDDIQKAMTYIANNHSGLKISYDDKGNTYTIRK